jgi:hypothetical protein
MKRALFFLCRVLLRSSPDAAWRYWRLPEPATLADAFPPGAHSYAGAAQPPPPALPCLGLGIVRAVDMARRLVYLLTDVPQVRPVSRTWLALHVGHRADPSPSSGPFRAGASGVVKGLRLPSLP